MASVFTSSIIPAPAAEVWEKVRDFNALPRWHPAIRDSRILDGQHSDQVGCVRDFNLQNGDRIVEQMVALSDYDMSVTYIILESPMPLTNYVATLRLTPVTDGAQTFAEWSAEFECAQEDEEGLVAGIGGDVFQVGFDALKRHFGGAG
ncbi:MAG: SRPBCC family protein [Rhodobacteraceae bacterium]|nr:SRPBCC family protein [Paracoccaceae bacterium]